MKYWRRREYIYLENWLYSTIIEGRQEYIPGELVILCNDGGEEAVHLPLCLEQLGAEAGLSLHQQLLLPRYGLNENI